jgi:chromosome segregation ATPase
MSHEPRMRGSRFRRSAAKKSSKEKREDSYTQFTYHEAEAVDPVQVSSKALNAVQHLGNQRFALPPFSEHFQRWMKDLGAVLTEFATKLPEVTDQEYKERVAKALAHLQENFSKRIEAEQNTSEEVSKLQSNMNQREMAITRLGNEQKAHSRETRRKFEKSQEKLRDEINSLDRKRLKMLRKKSGFLQRILHRSESRIEESTQALETTKRALGSRKEVFEQELEKSKAEHQRELEHLKAEAYELRKELEEAKGNKVDDALDIRQITCQDLHQAIEQAMVRFDQKKVPNDSASSQ